MAYREYPPAGNVLVAYDPEELLPADHLARLIERVVESEIKVVHKRLAQGRPEYDPRLCI